MITRNDILEAIARGWCYKNNEEKNMDTDLALAISNEIEKLLLCRGIKLSPNTDIVNDSMMR